MPLNRHGLVMKGIRDATSRTLRELPRLEPAFPSKFIHIGYRLSDGSVLTQLTKRNELPHFEDGVLYCGKVSCLARMQEISEIVHSSYRKLSDKEKIYKERAEYEQNQPSD